MINKKLQPIKIYIRADASKDIGCGHMMRCMALAEELKRRGADVNFICRELAGNIITFAEKKDFQVYHLPYIEKPISPVNQGLQYANWLGVDWQIDAEETESILKKENNSRIKWLIVDHYALDAQWENRVKPFVEKSMVIDDLADRFHHCDLLLDYNLYEDMKIRYNRLVPVNCKKLIGPKYALLRNEFKEARSKMKKYNGIIRNIVVFFGGSDLSNETTKVLKALTLINGFDIPVNVIIGINNPNRLVIEALAAKMPYVICHSQVENMAELLLAADLYIGAAGTTTWERCCLGLPSIVITVAKNQVKVIEYMAKKNLLFYIGENYKVSQSDIKNAVEYFLKRSGLLKRYSQSTFKLVDGMGTKRCADVIFGYN